MKKFKKNLSRTIFASFFVFQFVVSTSFMPLTAIADETRAEESVKEEKSEVKNEETVKEETKDESKEDSVENTVSEDAVETQSASDENVGATAEDTNSGEGASSQEENTQSTENETEPSDESAEALPLGEVQGQFVDGSIRVCKVVLDSRGNVVTDVSSAYQNASFTVTVLGPSGYSNDVVFDTDSFSSNITLGMDENSFQAMCEIFTVPVGVALISDLKAYTYNAETYTGEYEWEVSYNDTDFNTLVGFPYMDSDIPNSDGVLEFTGNVNTGFKTSLLVINKEIEKVKPTCDASINLISNGSFENPEVGNGAGWDIYENGTSGLVWTSEWNGFDPKVPAQIEIQENVSGWDAHTGDQYVELDSDQDGPGGGLNGEQASTTISQVIDTVPYQFYKVTYHFAARPGTPESDNRLGFYVDGELYDDVSASGMGLTQPYWQTRIFAFYAAGTQTTISFSDLGNPNSFGTFLDSVEVVCVDDEDPVNTPPKIKVVPDFVCIAVTDQSYAFLSGVSAYDAEDGSIIPTYTVSPNSIVFGEEGEPYTITYTATDSDGVSAIDFRTLVIKEKCGGGPTDPETSSVTVCKINEQGAYLSEWTLSLFSTESVEQVKVKPDGVIYPSASYGAGAYLLEANGQYVYRPSQPTGSTADAAFSLRIPSDEVELGLNPANFYEDTLYYQSNTTGNLGIRVNGNGPVWGDEFNPSHQYFFQTSNTVNTPFNFSILDNYYPDNSGFLTVDIYPGYTGVTDETGCITFEKVPFGTYDFSEVMKEGWEYVEGAGEVIVDEAQERFIIKNKQDGGTGGGYDDLTVNVSDSCVVRGTENFDFLSGISATHTILGDVTLVEGENVTITGDDLVDFDVNGEYTVTYTFNILGEEITEDRVIEVKTRCSGGGGGGGGSSSSGSGGNSQGEILGATTCLAFTTYNRLGNAGGEIKALQTFLNLYMDAGLIVDGVYGRTTAQAVHDFQAFHWKEVIDPWTPPLSPNTTGWQYKTTRMTINAIIDCPEAAVYLEDPGVMYQVTTVEGEKELTTAEMEEIYNLLAVAQAGQVLGVTDVNTNTNNTLDITDPNYDLMFGK